VPPLKLENVTWPHLFQKQNMKSVRCGLRSQDIYEAIAKDGYKEEYEGIKRRLQGYLKEIKRS
jgi:hypothetical protein